MADGLYKNKYHIKSARQEEYDYAQDGFYFITICSAGREMFFGDVIEGEMVLNDTGRIVAEEWGKTGIIRPYVQLDESIVMPNHLHGILVIDHSILNPRLSVEAPCQGVSYGGERIIFDDPTGGIFNYPKILKTFGDKTANYHD